VEQSFEQFCQRYLELKKSRTPMVVVTMTDERGSAPQNVGARMIVGREKILFGTVGGGKIEKRCIEECQKILDNPKEFTPKSYKWNLQKDIGMSCGGEVTMFFELFHPEEVWKVVIFGAGHVSQELTRLLLKLDCELAVIDPRPDWLQLLPEESGNFKKDN
jgi:xanthine dehydrogenase accessory factor